MNQRRYKIFNFVLIVFVLLAPYLYINIDASSTFTLENGKPISSTIYVNHSYNLKTGNRKVYYYTSNSSIIAVGKKSGRLVVKEPGKVTITAKLRGRSSTVCRKTFTVKRRSDYITSATKSLSLVTGDTKKVTIKKSPSNSTDVICFKSNNKKIATVGSKTGVIKAVGPGTTNIVVYSKSSDSVSMTNSSNRTLKIKVKVYSAATAAKQTEMNKVEVSFSADPASLKETDFTVTSSAGRKITVSSVSAVSKKATLTLGQNILDGKVYTVTYRSSSCSFTASDGIIKKFEISPVKIAINTETAVTANAYDKNGMFLGDYTYGNTYSNITFTVSSAYLRTNKRLYFDTTTGTASARIQYTKTVNGRTTTLADSGYVTISAYNPETISAQYRCTVTNNPTYTFTSTSTSNYSIPLNSGDFYAHFYILTSSNKEVSDYSQYRIESANKDIMIVAQDQLYDSQRSVPIIPIKVGTTYLHLKDSNGAVLYSFPITVQAESKLSAIKASKNNLYFLNTSGTIETIKLTTSDQYGYSMDNRLLYPVEIECISTTAKNLSADYINYYYTDSFYRYNYPDITFSGYDLPTGTYIYRIKYNSKIYETITVVISGKYIDFKYN